MAESRDANDPRDQLRALRKEARAEFEGEEAHDTGGQERASRAERGGEAGGATDEVARATREQDDAGALRVPRGDEPVEGGPASAGPGAAGPPGPHDDRDDR